MVKTLKLLLTATLGAMLLVSPFYAVNSVFAAQNVKQKVVKKKSAQKQTVRKAAQITQKAREEKATLESQQKNLQGEISSVKKEIKEKENRMAEATEALRKSEKSISQSNRTLKTLSDKKEKAEARLDDLSRQAKLVNVHVKDAESLVSMISQAQFINSQRDPWKRALVGANPNDINRESALLAYMAREQDRTINRLENRQKNIDAVAKKTEAARAEIVRIQKDEKENRARLEAEKINRSTALDTIKREIRTTKEKYDQLLKDNKELARLITVINQRIAHALALEKKEAREARHQKIAKSGPTPVKEAPVPVYGKFGNLKGKLTMPANGTIVAHFNQQREGAAAGLPWRGILINAKAGARVVAAAPGSVVYSDWLRGYGNLIILNHGSNYLSIYAYNNTLYKSVGETVKQGEWIADVGNSGGEEATGLYFELRYKDRPINPEKWLKKP